MKCNTCHNVYTEMPMFEDTEQASGCAANLYFKDGHHYILAFYGSSYDMQRFALAENTKYEVGNICDDCIESYINNNKAQLIEDGVW